MFLNRLQETSVDGSTALITVCFLILSSAALATWVEDDMHDDYDRYTAMNNESLLAPLLFLAGVLLVVFLVYYFNEQSKQRLKAEVTKAVNITSNKYMQIIAELLKNHKSYDVEPHGFGRMKLSHMKKHQPKLYAHLKETGELNQHIKDAEDQAEKYMEKALRSGVDYHAAFEVARDTWISLPDIESS
jgi:hypothetical protein